MLDIDFSNLPQAVSNEIFEDIKENLNKDKLDKLEFSNYDQSITVQEDNEFFYGELMYIVMCSFREKIPNQYQNLKYSDEKDLIKNGINITY